MCEKWANLPLLLNVQKLKVLQEGDSPSDKRYLPLDHAGPPPQTSVKGSPLSNPKYATAFNPSRPDDRQGQYASNPVLSCSYYILYFPITFVQSVYKAIN